MTPAHERKADTVIETMRGPVRVSKDRYMGGWRLYITDHIRFTDERFTSKREALAFLERFIPE